MIGLRILILDEPNSNCKLHNVVKHHLDNVTRGARGRFRPLWGSVPDVSVGHPVLARHTQCRVVCQDGSPPTETFLADVELRSPFSASCFINLQLIDVFTNLQDLVCNCGFAIAEFIDDILYFYPSTHSEAVSRFVKTLKRTHTDIAHL
jgi:hypothetical protein